MLKGWLLGLDRTIVYIILCDDQITKYYCDYIDKQYGIFKDSNVILPEYVLEAIEKLKIISWD